MNLNTEARQYLAASQNPEQTPVAWAFPTAIQQSRLDYSRASIMRIDALLKLIRQKYTPDEAFIAQPEVNAFLRLLSYYLGDFIARACETYIDWHDYESALSIPVLARKRPPISQRTQLIACIQGKPIFVYAMLASMLTDPHPEISAEEFVEDQLFNLRPPATLDESQRAELFLRAQRDGELLPGGLSYRAELKALDLDGSLESLERLNGLLLKLRAEKPNYQLFSAVAARRHFMLFCGYYYATTVARARPCLIQWLTHQEARDNFAPNMPLKLETMSCCLLWQQLYCPVALIGEILFTEANTNSLSKAAEETMAQVPAIVRMAYPTPAQIQAIQGKFDSDPLLHGCAQAGRIAASALATMAEHGQPCAPQLYEFDRQGPQQPLNFAQHAQPNKAGLEALNANAAQRPYAIFITDGFANLPEQRTDALILALRYREANQAVSVLNINFPYRASSLSPALRLAAPIVQESNLPEARLAEALDALYLGLLNTRTPSFNWDACFIDPAKPAA